MSMLLNPYALATGGGGGGSLPPGATAQLDFINGFYYAGGSAQSVSSLLGGGFDPSAISGSGMLVRVSNSNRPNAIGSLFSDMASGIAAGCTILMEVDFPDNPVGSFVHFLNTPGYGASTQWASCYVGGLHAPYLEAHPGISFDYTANSLLATGIHKIAITFYRNAGGGNYEFALSVDGAAATTQTTMTGPFSPFTTIPIAHDGDNTILWDAGYLRTFTLYPAKLPSDLPALTT